jgi:hypothetical protein
MHRLQTRLQRLLRFYSPLIHDLHSRLLLITAHDRPCYGWLDDESSGLVVHYPWFSADYREVLSGTTEGRMETDGGMQRVMARGSFGWRLIVLDGRRGAVRNMKP